MWLVGATVGVLLLDRLRVWAERRGWIYLQHRPRGAAGVMLGPLAEVFQPSSTVQMIEQQRQAQVPDLAEDGQDRDPTSGSAAGDAPDDPADRPPHARTARCCGS